MKFLSWIRGKNKQKRPAAKRSVASYLASLAKNDSWALGSNDPNDVRHSAKKTRQYARDLEETNPFAEAFLRDYVTNVIGPCGFRFQSKVTTARGKVDKSAREAVEFAFMEWKRNPWVSADMTYADGMQLIARSFARDGSVFIRKIIGWPNESGFALQMIDADMLAEDFDARLSDGRKVMGGIETDQWDRVTAYYFFESHPDAPYGRSYNRIRVPSDQIIHHYPKKRIGRKTGISPMVSVFWTLRNLALFEENETTAARASACAFASIEREEGTFDGEADDNNQVELPPQKYEFAPGAVWQPPAGTEVKLHKPEHPVSGLGEFRKAILRGIATGVGVTYNSLGSDLEGVSYSSLREGNIRERDLWTAIQDRHIREVEMPVFLAWLQEALLNGAVPGYSIADFDKLKDAAWQGRRWAWVDPKKDVEATLIELQNGLTTMTKVLAKMGEDDPSDLIKELKQEIEEWDAAGLKHPYALALESAEHQNAQVETASGGSVDPEEEDSPARSVPKIRRVK